MAVSEAVIPIHGTSQRALTYVGHRERFSTRGADLNGEEHGTTY
jgi:hypothetical protein